LSAFRGAPIELVIDTSAVLAVLLREPERDGIIAVTRGATLLAAPTLPWEIDNALVALIRRRRLTGRAAQQAWQSFQQIPVRLVDVDVGEALEMAEALGLYAYDAYVLEAARTQRVPLLSLDRQLQRAATAKDILNVEVQG
jgi:predicted nucleic acid-binding protein